MKQEILNDIRSVVDEMKRDFQYRIYRDMLDVDGGPGSGYFGHAGRKGLRGGSAAKGGASVKASTGAKMPTEGGAPARSRTVTPSKEAVARASEARTYDPDRVPAIRDMGRTDTQWAKPGDLLSKYTRSDGSLTPEREQMHQDIIKKHFEGATKAQGQPTCTIMGGGPASGKSTLRNSGMANIPEDSVTVDCDGVKDMLPEYQEMLGKRDKDAAKYCHSESSTLAERIRNVAMKEGYNLVDDGTGNGSTRDILGKISAAHEAGMKVKGVYVTVPTDVALERAAKRGEETGRIVPEEIIRKTHAGVSRDLPQVADQFDELELYDMSGDGPVLIATGGSGKPLTPVEGMEELYQAFLAKADEPY